MSIPIGSLRTATASGFAPARSGNLYSVYLFCGDSREKGGATDGANAVDIVGMNTFRSETEANAQNFAIHRAFIDGGAVKAGFFFMKYVVRGQRIVSNIGSWIK